MPTKPPTTKPPIHTHHVHDCTHERLKFCNICKKPYCLDCGTEWNPPVYTAPSFTMPANTIEVPWGNIEVKQNNSTAGPFPRLTPTTCTHH
jgi:hypothetical protein